MRKYPIAEQWLCSIMERSNGQSTCSKDTYSWQWVVHSQVQTSHSSCVFSMSGGLFIISVPEQLVFCCVWNFYYLNHVFEINGNIWEWWTIIILREYKERYPINNWVIPKWYNIRYWLMCFQTVFIFWTHHKNCCM